MITDSVRTDEGGQVKPRGSRTAGTGSVIDPREGKYPSTHTFASEPSANPANVKSGRECRRPGGMYRGAKHGFKSVHCYCDNHPCTCNTDEAKKALGKQSEGRRSTVQM